MLIMMMTSDDAKIITLFASKIHKYGREQNLLVLFDSFDVKDRIGLIILYAFMTLSLVILESHCQGYLTMGIARIPP